MTTLLRDLAFALTLAALFAVGLVVGTVVAAVLS